MAEQDVKQTFLDAIVDADSLERFINGSDDETVMTRLNAEYPTLKNAVKQLFVNGGLPATPFKTKADMESSSLAVGSYAQVTDDADESGLYIKGSGGWTLSEYNPLSKAKAYTDEQRALGDNFSANVFFYNPYYEFYTNQLYVKLYGGAGDTRLGYVMDKRLVGEAGNRIYMLRSDFEAELARLGRSYVNSPKGVEGCIRLFGKEQLVFDLDANILTIRDLEEPGNHIIMVGMDSSRLSLGIEGANVYYQTSKQEIEAVKSRVTDIENSTVRNELDDSVKAIAHRGYSKVAPENTLEAYILAKKMGFSYVETDVRFTADNVPVLLHDSTVDRTSDGSGDISSFTLEQVKQLDFGAWKSEAYQGVKIPTLDEFLNLCLQLNLHPYIELKNLSTEQVVDIVQRVDVSGLKGGVTFIATAINALRAVNNNANYAYRFGVVGDADNIVVDRVLTLKREFVGSEVFADVSAGVLSKLPSFIEYARSNNVAYEFWAVYGASGVILASEQGATGITTDDLNVRKILNDKYGV